MGESSENKPNKHKKHICLGILAHVDAGRGELLEKSEIRIMDSDFGK